MMIDHILTYTYYYYKVYDYDSSFFSEPKDTKPQHRKFRTYYKEVFRVNDNIRIDYSVLKKRHQTSNCFSYSYRSYGIRTVLSLLPPTYPIFTKL